MGTDRGTPPVEAVVRALLIGVLLITTVACSSSRHSASAPTTTTTLGGPSISRGEVTDIKVWSLPESPVLNWSAERAHWADVRARIPDPLPSAPPLDTCKIGPALSVRLASHNAVTYECSLPPSIKALRDYILSLPR